MKDTSALGSTAVTTNKIWPLPIADGVLLVLILIVLPAYAIRKASEASDVSLKRSALPLSSVGSMLALTVVESFV